MKALVLLATLSAAPHTLDRDAVSRLLQLPLTESHRAGVSAPNSHDYPATPLALTLLGTLVDTTQTLCAALVHEATATRTLFVGSAIERGTVVWIARDEVVIERDGAFESLRSHPTKGSPTAPPAPASTGGITRLADGNFRVATSDLTAWMSARVIPTTDGGLKIFGVKDGSPYTTLGIRNGDVLRSVNGQPVDFRSISLIRPGIALNVELERDGHAFSLSGQLE